MSEPKDKLFTVAVDFDGVLHSYTTPWIAADVIPDPPVDGAIDWLRETAKHFEIVIFTTRGFTAGGRAAVREWLLLNGWDGGINVHVTHEKPAALIYLDDRAVRFEGPGSWPSVEAIHHARPWNKR